MSAVIGTSISTRLLAGALAAASGLAAGPALAADGALSASYSVSFAGFPLAKANLLIQRDKDSYVARAGYRVTGVAKVVSGAKGEAKSVGAVKGPRVQPASYELDGDDSKSSHVEMSLAGGAVKGLAVEPPAKVTPYHIPMKPEHRVGVIDPLSAIVLPVDKPGDLGPSACERTLPIFDGWTRYDVKLSYKGTEQVKKAGYSGPAVVCAARWLPIAGHRPDRPATKFLQESSDLELALAPIGDTGLLAPVRVAVMTISGKVVIEADRFEFSAEKHAGN